jgi:hypothetical protein
VRLYDLDERRFVAENPGGAFDMGVTNHDFVAVCERK